METIQHINDVVADMKKRVDFNATDHTYINLETGAWLQGVSSVSSIVPKDWLSAWGAKEAVKALGYSDYEGDTERAMEVMTAIKELETPEEFIALLKEAKGASRRKSKDALVDGKAGHAWLEEYVKSQINKTVIPDLPKGNLARPISQFFDWEKENVEYWILSEALVANPEKGYAGTMDAMAMMKTGKLAVIDFKFASHISEDYYLQTAGYAACFEMYSVVIDERIIIRLPKTLLKEEWNDEKKKYEMVDNNIEVEIVKTNYEADKNAFFHALPVKQWCNQFVK